MDLKIIILNEVSTTGKNKYHNAITYMWNLKNNTNELSYKTEQTHRHRQGFLKATLELGLNG